MRRHPSSTRRRTPVRSSRRGSFFAGAVWEVLVPAFCIALVGAGAVGYLVVCARLSVIECDLRRLERIADEEKARELDLHRQLAELRNVERIRSYIVERDLSRPMDVAHVVLKDVPPALYPILPTGGAEELGGEMRLGQLPPDMAGPLSPAASLPR